MDEVSLLHSEEWFLDLSLSHFDSNWRFTSFVQSMPSEMIWYISFGQLNGLAFGGKNKLHSQTVLLLAAFRLFSRACTRAKLLLPNLCRVCPFDTVGASLRRDQCHSLVQPWLALSRTNLWSNKPGTQLERPFFA